MPASKNPKYTTAAIILAPGLAKAEEATLIELKKLLEGLGVEVLDQVIQRSTPAGSSQLIGSGKLEELKSVVEEHVGRSPEEREIVLVVAADISPAQQRTLEAALDIPVLDRSGVILQVFEARAQTSLARLEVSLARARYSLPRVRDDHALGDKEGGGGRGGKGDSNVELRKQMLRKTISELEKRISANEKTRTLQQKERKDMHRVALVGYTNAGKSSLMSALCGQEVYIADQLFATLSTTVRSLPKASPPILVSDTIGFMRALPHDLLRSFRSTLMEATEANLRLIVVDAADPDWQDELAVTYGVLDDLGATRDNERLVFNKIDKLGAEALAGLREVYPDALFISAHSPEDVLRVRQELVAFFDKSHVETVVRVPFSDGKFLARLHSETHVVETREAEEGLDVVVRASSAALVRLGVIPDESSQDEREEWMD